MAKWDFEREYHIGRIDGAFYVIDDRGNAIEGPYDRVKFSHVGFSNSDQIRAHGEEGRELLTKSGKEYDYPTNLTMEISVQ